MLKGHLLIVYDDVHMQYICEDGPRLKTKCQIRGGNYHNG